jgi:hypothetical protein
MKLIQIIRVGTAARHNAFTSMVQWHNRLWLVYREGTAHVSPDGAIRVLCSDDGQRWQSAARISQPGRDLRDPKICVTPDGRLMLLAASVVRPKGAPMSLANRVWLSRDGQDWGQAHTVGEPNLWLWRVSWQGQRGWGVAYSVSNAHQGRPRFVRLYLSYDGLNFTPQGQEIFSGGYPNEHAMIFTGGTAWCLLRCDDQRGTAMLGRSIGPSQHWQWQPLGVPLGGPQMLADGLNQAWVGARLYDGKVRTALCRLDLPSAKLQEVLAVPSGGDNSYPDMLWYGDRLLLSYYSAHEGFSCVYVAQMARA